ncbi:MAG: HAD-IA family hydrolase [Alphaproteobacteria bacterium]
MSYVFRLIIFDFDGTLVDSQRAILAAMAQAFTAHSLPVPAPEAVRRIVGLKLEIAIARLLPDSTDDAMAHRVADSYRTAYFTRRQRPDYEEPLYPGVQEGLQRLNTPQVCLGIATGKSRRGLLASLERNGIREHFVTLQTAEDGPSKPHPEIVHLAMAEVGVEAAETVLIGDTTYDMEMAGNAGVAAIGVAWGYHGPAELRASGAERIVERFADLPAALATMSRAHACG